MGIAGGVDNLVWLFTGTLAGMLLIHPVFTTLVKSLPRKRFVPLTYRFFIANLVVFFALFQLVPEGSVWIGRLFFIWVSIYNLFVISVFWSFMTDIYRSAQSKRLFGVLAVGGTIGAMTGSGITSALVQALGPVNLLLISALMLEAAARVSGALEKAEQALALAGLQDCRMNGRTRIGPTPTRRSRTTPRPGRPALCRKWRRSSRRSSVAACSTVCAMCCARPICWASPC